MDKKQYWACLTNNIIRMTEGKFRDGRDAFRAAMGDDIPLEAPLCPELEADVLTRGQAKEWIEDNLTARYAIIPLGTRKDEAGKAFEKLRKAHWGRSNRWDAATRDIERNLIRSLEGAIKRYEECREGLIDAIRRIGPDAALRSEADGVVRREWIAGFSKAVLHHVAHGVNPLKGLRILAEKGTRDLLWNNHRFGSSNAYSLATAESKRQGTCDFIDEFDGAGKWFNESKERDKQREAFGLPPIDLDAPYGTETEEDATETANTSKED